MAYKKLEKSSGYGSLNKNRAEGMAAPNHLHTLEGK